MGKNSQPNPMTFLPIVALVDNFPYELAPQYFKLISHDGATLGYLTPDIAELLGTEKGLTIDTTIQTVQINNDMDTETKRSEMFANIAGKWRQMDRFHESLDKQWRNELYCVYNPTSVPYFLVERAFSVLLGVATYGVHMNAYIPADKSVDGKLKLWIPRRSATKQTYPLKLDNTVAGGIGYPYGVYETVLKECQEEAGLDAHFVSSRIKSAGVVQYMFMPFASSTETGSSNVSPLTVQPEVEYIYDLPLHSEKEVTPSPVDGEVDSFKLMDVDQVLDKISQGEFKPNCALVMVDFLVRHGYIRPDTEKNYMEIVTRCHRRFPFPGM